ncbi:SafA/ExsA family spore coat assembly protein [Ornithinibacillus contaminans]|uniref:SafA/ExsA family spore coat assembly protein n=1 Tax=Ornithinibacillus contaminans TaxID=694055 RepID=UPI0006A77C7B|nr:SafA/ExsA family spore coat assembly protein [Ornithinibacillus contaminans]
MKIHIVQKGDILWELSKQYGVDFEQLKQANSHIASPDMIMPGMKIRIPTSAKTVKKETALKEMQTKPKEVQIQPQVEQPYLDISPKPLPVINEDEVQPIKEVQPQMPMPQMPQMPQIPQPLPQPISQPETAQFPLIEQELNYLTFNFPTDESSTAEAVHPIEQPAQQPIQQPVQQPIYHPIQQPVQMVPCFPVHPCYGGVPVGPQPVSLPQFMPQQMGYPAPVMPIQEMAYDDCGCGGGRTTMNQFPPMGIVPEFGFNPNVNLPNQAFTMPTQTGPTSTYPTMSGHDTNAFPTPPSFGDLRTQDKEELSE